MTLRKKTPSLHQQQQHSSNRNNNNKKLRIAFVHPDLGIGGAERLVVDAAIGLQNAGHEVVMFTSHHDPTHCFEETRNGTLDVRVRGDFLPNLSTGRKKGSKRRRPGMIHHCDMLICLALGRRSLGRGERRKENERRERGGTRIRKSARLGPT